MVISIFLFFLVRKLLRGEIYSSVNVNLYWLVTCYNYAITLSQFAPSILLTFHYIMLVVEEHGGGEGEVVKRK